MYVGSERVCGSFGTMIRTPRISSSAFGRCRRKRRLMASMWVRAPFCTRDPQGIYIYISFSDSLRRRLTWWLLWATRSDSPFIIVSTQATEKRTPNVRRRGRERRMGARWGKCFFFFFVSPRLTWVLSVRVNIGSPSTTRY